MKARLLALIPGRWSLFLALSATSFAQAPSASDDATAEAEGGAVVKLSPFEVSERNGDSYTARESVAATRIALPLKDLPINVQVITSEFLRDAVVLDIVDALRYKGVNANRDIRFNSTFIRGFNNRILKRNGVRRDLNWGTANVERIEIVKGPASILYGEANPGGTILYVTKKPVAREFAELEIQVGTDDFYRGVLDFGGRVAGRKDVLFRVVAERQDSKNFYDGAYVDKWFLNPTVTWQITPKLSLELEYEYTYHKEQQVMYYFKTTQAVLDAPPLTLDTLPNPVPFFHSEIRGLTGQVALTEFFSQSGRAPVSDRYNGSSRDSFIKLETDWYEATLSYRFDNDWVLRWKYAHETTNDDELEFGANGNSDLLSGGLLGVADWRARDNVNDRITTFIETTGKYEVGSFLNTAIVGYEYRKDDLNAKLFTPPVRVNSPLTGQPLPVRGNRVVIPVAEIPLVRFGDIPDAGNFRARPSTILRRDSFYGFNQIESPDRKWLALLGLRYEEGENNPLSAGVRPQNRFDDWTKQLGAAYRWTADHTVFFNYSESFLPIESINPNGETFTPETGLGYELGIRNTFQGGRLATTLTAWENSREDILQADLQRTFQDPVNNPTNQPYSQQGGLWRTRGVDFEAQFSIVPRWQLTTSISWIPYAKIEENTSNLMMVGRRLRYVPELAGSVWSKYQFESGLRVLSGVSFQTETDWDDTGLSGTYQFDPWASVDLGVGYTFAFEGGKLHLDLFAQNLTDNELTTVIRPQDRRRLFVKASVAF